MTQRPEPWSHIEADDLEIPHTDFAAEVTSDHKPQLNSARFFWLVHRGSIEIETPNGPIQASAGDLLIRRPGQLFRMRGIATAKQAPFHCSQFYAYVTLRGVPRWKPIGRPC